ncbi:RIB43A-like with coiled-coils protein 2 [Arctopsyche grandis]|uniref:RIB43A-like with coiled-coils protein 2 n=1 Tax=Arctopsyche grandis TaxID=121162 RepID=UPI00406D67B8
MIGNLYIATEKDKAEVRERERRRQIELERQARIFNPRIRKIGVDVNALQSQIYEKKVKEEAERNFENAFDRQMLKDNQLAEVLNQRENEERQRISNNINEYRKTFQNQIDSREYDLNDPNILKKQLPPRSTDEDVGLPSGQKFEGEDLYCEERTKIMREQCSSWLQQQIHEKQAKDAEQKAAERAYKQAIIARDQRALQLELIERDCKKQLESANAHYNKILAEEKSNKITNDLNNENEDNLAEMYNTLSSDLMTENPNTARSVFGPHRSITYMYKGMSPEEKYTIRMIQLNQIAEHKVSILYNMKIFQNDGSGAELVASPLKLALLPSSIHGFSAAFVLRFTNLCQEFAQLEADKKLDNDWENIVINMSNLSALSDTENQKKRRTMAMKVKEENLMLSKQQKDKKAYYDKIVYRNEPTDEYFSKFNTSSR